MRLLLSVQLYGIVSRRRKHDARERDDSLYSWRIRSRQVNATECWDDIFSDLQADIAVPTCICYTTDTLTMTDSLLYTCQQLLYTTAKTTNLRDYQF